MFEVGFINGTIARVERSQLSSFVKKHCREISFYRALTK